MVIEYVIHPRSAYMYRGPSSSARASSPPPYVPWVFRRRASKELGARRPPPLPYHFGPLRWVVSWASRSYMAAVVGGSGFRRAIAWRVLAVFAPLKWAHSYVWWVK